VVAPLFVVSFHLIQNDRCMGYEHETLTGVNVPLLRCLPGIDPPGSTQTNLRLFASVSVVLASMTNPKLSEKKKISMEGVG